MPTVTTVALDSLLLTRKSADHRPRSSANNSNYRAVDGASSGSQGRLDDDDQVARRATTTSSSPSPALYATPKSFRISVDPTASSDSLSPYVVDRKGRARGPAAVIPAPVPSENGYQGIENGEVGQAIEKQRDQGEEDEKSQVPTNKGVQSDARVGDAARLATEDTAQGSDDEAVFDDDFFDSRASLRSVSFSDAESSGGTRRVTFRRHDPGSASFTNTNEYYDAGTHFGLDSPAAGAGSSSRRLLDEMESELRSMRLGLFDELEKRAKAEEALARLRDRWNRMALGLSKVGLSSFASIPVDGEDGGEDLAELVGSEILVTRTVSEAIARGVGVAEGEQFVQAAVHAKNREIARLRERLNYYEAVNHEMSQRNLEIAEQARRRRQRRKTVRRFMWASIAVAAAAGVSFLAYTYLPPSSNTSSPPPTDDMEGSSSSS